MRQIDVTLAAQEPLVSYEKNAHAIDWQGIHEPTAFRANCYMIRDGEQCLIVDPGNRVFLPQVRKRVAAIQPHR